MVYIAASSSRGFGNVEREIEPQWYVDYVNTSASSVYRRALLWVPPVLYAALIFKLSSESTPLPELTSWVWDKALHATEYAGLALLLCRAARGEGLGWAPSLALALVTASGYAGSDEWHQLRVLGRESDILDWVADTVGAAVGCVAYGTIAAMFGASP